MPAVSRQNDLVIPDPAGLQTKTGLLPDFMPVVGVMKASPPGSLQPDRQSSFGNSLPAQAIAEAAVKQ